MAAQGETQSRRDALERLAHVGTYRTLGEQKLSPQEERFEKARRTIGLFLAPAVFLIFLLLPLDMDETQQKLAAALLFVIVLWISEAVPIPIGGLMGIALRRRTRSSTAPAWCRSRRWSATASSSTSSERS